MSFSDITSPFVHDNSSQSSISTNRTEDGLIGPGRTLGLLYAYLGRKIENQLNRLALNRGLGPEAAFRRIVSSVESEKSRIGSLYPDWPRDYRACEKEKAKAVKYLVERREIVSDCLALLRYVRSDVASNQCLALQYVASLAINEPYFRTFFNALGTLEFLEKFDPRFASCDLRHKDLLLSSSRRALLSLSEIEVNSLGRRLLESYSLTGKDEEDDVKGIIATLCSYSRDREISFLAHRYLRSSRWLRGGAAHLFFDTVKAYYMELAEHILQDLSSVEMDGIDSLFCGLVYRYWEIFPTFSTYATSESFDMRRIGEVILRSSVHFSQFLGILHRLDSLSSLREHGNREEIRAAVIILTGRDLNGSDFVLDKYLSTIRELSRKYQQPNLGPLWKSFASGPSITLLRALSFRGGRQVVEEPLRQSLCEDLINCLASSDEQTRARAVEGVNELLKFDRYFKQTMSDALAKRVSDTQESNLYIIAIARQIYDINITDRIYRPRYLTFSSVYLGLAEYRHISTDSGHVHLTYQPISHHSPCSECSEMGIWEEWLHSDFPSCQRLCVLYDENIYTNRPTYSSEYCLKLHLHKGEVFSSSGHIPILAGINNIGQEEYLCDALRTVVDGEKLSQPVWVYVLRYDPRPEMAAAVESFGGVDATGPFFWKDCDASDFEETTASDDGWYDDSDDEEDGEFESDGEGDEDSQGEGNNDSDGEGNEDRDSKSDE